MAVLDQVPVEWWALVLGVVSLIVTVGLRMYDYRSRPSQRRIERTRPLLVSLRNKFAAMERVKLREYDEWSKELGDAFFTEIESLYRQAVDDGLDFVLDKEAKSIKKDLEDFSSRLQVHREELTNSGVGRKPTLAGLMLNDSRVLYVILETPTQITNWLKKHA